MKFVASCLLAISIVLGGLLSAHANTQWPEWNYFKQHYMRIDGRIVDPDSPNKITTSEGQSYALFFALAANDKETFRLLLEWTENNLSNGDITAQLPSWLWGKRTDGSWGVIDENSASDSDIWIAYSLLEAGRLWDIREYESKGFLLLKRIMREETANIPGLGWMLLPGKEGFIHKYGWKLNPSYQPIQILSRFSQLTEYWDEIEKNSMKLLVETSPNGFVPDWVWWREGTGWKNVEGKEGMGGYDSIRSYLWVGMLPEQNKQKKRLVKLWKPMLSLITSLGHLPERINVMTGDAQGYGNSGIAYALLPFAYNNQEVMTIIKNKITDSPPNADTYYSYVLMLFALGWEREYFHFDNQGKLYPNWNK